MVRLNPLGTQGNIAQRYGDLVKDLWSGTAKSIAPLKLRVSIDQDFDLEMLQLNYYLFSEFSMKNDSI